jgi:hypothetical protein
MKCFGAMASCSAISSAAAHLLAAFSSSFGKAERINTSGKEERGAIASSVSRRSSRSLLKKIRDERQEGRPPKHYWAVRQSSRTPRSAMPVVWRLNAAPAMPPGAAPAWLY